MKFVERYEAFLHVIGWAVFVGLPFLTLPSFLWNREDMISMGMAQLLTNALIISFFYVNLRGLTPGLLHSRHTQRFLLILVAMLVSVVLVKVICFYVFPPAFMAPRGMVKPPPVAAFPGSASRPAIGAVGPSGPHSPWPGVLSSAISFGFAMLVSSLIALFRYNTRTQEMQQQMVLEKVSAELAMLKLQVSPHFLFNTLNNIRWLARQKSDQTETAVVTLAQLLRYMIYQAQRDRVSLRQEVQHLQDYIDLQKMRLTDMHTVEFRCEGDIDAYQIEPLLFIPFVENAFKYGFHGQQPGKIRIELVVHDNKLTFCIENPSVQPILGKLLTESADDQPEKSSGIGIANVQKRLALHYPNQHELRLTNEDNLFRVVLTISLHHGQVALHRR